VNKVYKIVTQKINVGKKLKEVKGNERT